MNILDSWWIRRFQIVRLPQIFFAGGSNLMYVFFPPLLQFRKSKGPGHMPVRSRQLFVDLILYINVFVYCKYNKEQSILNKIHRKSAVSQVPCPVQCLRWKVWREVWWKVLRQGQRWGKHRPHSHWRSRWFLYDLVRIYIYSIYIYIDILNCII